MRKLLRTYISKYFLVSYIFSDLGDRFGVEGIPALIIVKPDGTVITKEGRSEVSNQPARAVFSSWKSKV
jgi:hypothetical protein